MHNKKNTDTSKFLSYILRHAPESIGLALDQKAGPTSISSLPRQPDTAAAWTAT